MTMLGRLKEYRRSTSVNTLADSISLLVNRLSNNLRVTKIGNLDVSLLNSLVSEKPVIVEVGSFNGKDTLKFGRAFPSGRIFGFEPVPELYSVAVRRNLHMKNVVILQCAVSNVIGWVRMNVSNGTSRASSSILDPEPVSKFFRGIVFDPENQVSVPSITLESWKAQYKIDKVDLLWMDVQGAEGLVLEGFGEALRDVSAIYTEINFEKIYEGASLFAEIKSFLESKGFCLAELWPDGPSGDALFVRESFLPS